MPDFSVPQGETHYTNGRVHGAGTVQGHADNSAYGEGGGTLITGTSGGQGRSWNARPGEIVAVKGGTLQIGQAGRGNANFVDFRLDNATLAPTLSAQHAVVDMKYGVDRFIASPRIAAGHDLEHIRFTDLKVGDQIEIAGARTHGAAPTFHNNILTFTLGGKTYTVAVTLAPNAGSPIFSYGLGADGNYYVKNGPPCFLAGSRILTPTGPVAVEDLAVGDDVIAERDGVRAARPILWIGRRSVRSRDLPPEYAHPVRIRAHAFAPDVPGRDLLLTADHGVLADGGLIPVRLLLNDGSIVLDDTIREYTYFHVELAEHAILLAEGLPAESYLETGNRARFANAPVAALRPADDLDEARRIWETQAVAPLTVDPAAVAPVWRRLAARAECLGYPSRAVRTSNGRELDIRLVADGKAVLPVWLSDSAMMFSLPRRAATLVLASAATTWLERAPWIDDRRTLGIPVRRIAYMAGADTIDLPLDDPSMETGWHGCEGDAWSFRRWTVGAGEIPVHADAYALIVELHADCMAALYSPDSELAAAA